MIVASLFARRTPYQPALFFRSQHCLSKFLEEMDSGCQVVLHLHKEKFAQWPYSYLFVTSCPAPRRHTREKVGLWQVLLVCPVKVGIDEETLWIFHKVEESLGQIVIAHSRSVVENMWKSVALTMEIIHSSQHQIKANEQLLSHHRLFLLNSFISATYNYYIKKCFCQDE